MLSHARVRALDAQPDDRLLALARDGDERAFETLLERYRKPLVAHAKRLLPATRAEDAVQQGLLQAWLALQRGNDVRDVKPWLYRIVHNTAMRMRRAARDDHAPLADTLAAPDTPHADLERQIDARDALAQVAALPGLQREVLLQTAVGGRSRFQVAAALGLTDDAVRGLIYRARTKLRAAACTLIPSPLVTWAMRLAGKRTPSLEPLSRAGSTTRGGIAAVLAKGGAVAVTVSVVAVGGRAVHSRLWPDDAHGAGNVRSRHLFGARMPRPRIDADRAHVQGVGSASPVVARSAATSTVSHVSIHLTSLPASPRPGLTRREHVQSRAAARGIGSSASRAHGGVTSASHTSTSSGSGSIVASSAPARTSGSDTANSLSTGRDGGHSKADSESGGDGSATARAAAADTPRVSTGEGDTGGDSSGNDGNTSGNSNGNDSNTSVTPTSVTSSGGDRSSPGATPEAAGNPSTARDGSTAPQSAAPTAPPNSDNIGSG